ncbi:MAG: BLUF domain-containing protein [Chloroflexota bacterium]
MRYVSLVYVSFATQEMSGDNLEGLLLQCKKNNASRGITGMLLYRDGYFIQALEGEEDVVMDLFRKIERDTRHSNVIIAHKESITERSFDEWSMGYKNISGVDLSKYPEYRDYEEFSPEYFVNNPSRDVSLLNSFYDEINF